MSVTAAQFPPALRLLTAAQYQAVFKQTQQKSGNRHLLILATANLVDVPRLGMAISIKNSENAVNRNRIKRLVRETFRKQRQYIAVLDYIVLTRKGVTALSNRQIVDTLIEHWQTITTRCEK